MKLSNFEKNIQSQFGEDGVIEEIFNNIENKNFYCVEFGAWDGIYLSNTWNLWHNHDWSSLLIEGNDSKMKELEENIKKFSKVKALNAFVSPKGKYSLDQILPQFNVPINLDLLSVDIDGDEYYIFESLELYRPKLIILEYNPTIPPHIELVQSVGEYMGCSALALIKLGKKKQYRAVHITTTNIFFLTDEIFEKGEFIEIDLVKDFKYDFLVSVITSYDGISYLSDRLPYLPEIPPKQTPTIFRLIKNLFKRSDKQTNKIPSFNSKAELIPVELFKK